MNILFLDTASVENSLAICSGVACYAPTGQPEEETIIWKPLAEKGDSALIPAIEEVLEQNKMGYEDLTHLACVIGPGGFTSLRVGVTAINTLAYTLDLPSTGIHLSDLWSSRASLPGGAKHALPLRWLHSTRRSQLFVKDFNSDEIKLLDINDARSLEGNYVGELIDEHKQTLTKCSPLENLLSLREVLPMFLSKQHYEKIQLVPWYGREAN